MRTNRLIAALLVVLIACGEPEAFPAQPSSVTSIVPEPTANYTAPTTRSPTPTPTPAPTPVTSLESTPVVFVAAAPEKKEDPAQGELTSAKRVAYHSPSSVGDLRSMEERIIDSDLIAIARMINVIGAVETVDYGSRSGYVGVLKFTFGIEEVLKSPGGSPPTQVIAMVSTTLPLETRAEARTVAQRMLSERDTQWDERDAIIFLASSSAHYPATAAEDVYFMSFIDYFTGIGDSYSIASRELRLWLPEANPGSDNDGNRRFLTAVPRQTSTQASSTLSSGASTAPDVPSVALADLRTDINRLTKEQRADTYIGYQYCVSQKYRRKREEVEFADRGGPEPEQTFTKEISSGAPAGTEVLESTWKTVTESNVWESKSELAGPNASLFRLGEMEESHAVSYDWTNTIFAVKQTILYVWYDQPIESVRPLTAGVYDLTWKYTRGAFVLCAPELAVNHTVTVTVTAPEGTLHELFFDPVNIGAGVGADSTNGVLEPATYTDSSGRSGNIESISYEAGSVSVTVGSGTSLSGQVLDFIGLDGEVSLSLNVERSTYHSGRRAFVWTVASQPWQDGDKLMVRIRRAPPYATAPAGLRVSEVDGSSVGLVWRARDGVTGYRVEYRESGQQSWEVADGAVTETEYTISGLSCATTYEFRVGSYGDGTRFRKRIGPGSYSATSGSTDACSQPPTFDAASYSFKVSEDAVAGTQVGTVSATDPDVGDTLTYSITSGNDDGKFGIAGSTGVITVASGLDYDTSSSYSLEVQADDGRGGSATVRVSISVTEVVVVGNAPVFGASSYSFSVVESASVGSTVGAVEATDADEGDTVTYSITSGNDAGKFGIDGTSGRITLAAGLDHATASSYTLGVEATDGNGGRGRATVAVAVELAACSNGTVVANPSEKADLVKDCLTLLSLRDALEGTAVLNWSADVPIGRWRGIGVSGRVVALQLLDAGLDGTVPAGIGKLSGLNRLDLSTNELTGGIPSELGGLAALGWLTLDENSLTGSVPSSLGSLSSLVSLSIADNGLTGMIPSSLGNLSRLLYLSLGGNDLSGSIPTELGSIAGLQILYLDANDLTGGIPVELARLTKLEILALHGNDLTGSIPSELGGLSKLEELMLSRNDLTGSIPASLEKLTKLVYLRLSGNQFTGCIPAGLRNVTDHDLGRLSLSYCATEA